MNDIIGFLSVDQNNLVGLSVYPNPAHDTISIQTPTNGQKEVKIYDVTGKKVIDTMVDVTLEVSALSTSTYRTLY